MDNAQKFYDLLWGLLEQLPSLISILACLIFAVTRWKRCPKVAPLVVVSLVLLLLHGPIFAAVYNWVPDLLVGSDTTASARISNNVMLMLSLIYHTALAIPFTLLLVSIFRRRDEAPGEASAN